MVARDIVDGAERGTAASNDQRVRDVYHSLALRAVVVANATLACPSPSMASLVSIIIA